MRSGLLWMRWLNGRNETCNNLTLFMQTTDLIGSIAATLTTASFLPQAWHTFRTRDVSGISLGMYSVFTLGVALWLVYGLLMNAWPIVVANAITVALAFAILVMKLQYQPTQQKSGSGSS
jgi:MtN3 and saliva related transmembrane protein